MGKSVFLLIFLVFIGFEIKVIESKNEKRQASTDKNTKLDTAATTDIHQPHRKQAFRFGYDIKDEHTGHQFRQEDGDYKGVVRGRYGYHDPFGIYREVEYIADALGFRAIVKSNEPGLGQQNPAFVDVIKTALPVKGSVLHYAASEVPSKPAVIKLKTSSSTRHASKSSDLKTSETSSIKSNHGDSIRNSHVYGQIPKKEPQKQTKEEKVTVLIKHQLPRLKNEAAENYQQRERKLPHTKNLPMPKLRVEYPKPQEITELAPIPYLLNSEGKHIFSSSPSLSEYKYPTEEEYVFSKDPKGEDYPETLVLSQSDLSPITEISYPAIKEETDSKGFNKEETPFVITKDQSVEYPRSFKTQFHHNNKKLNYPFILVKDNQKYEYKGNPANDIRGVTAFVLDKDLKTAGSDQKIRCPLVCLLQSYREGRPCELPY